MSLWEPNICASDEWYTPAHIFDALGEIFDLDVSAPRGGGPHVPCRRYLTKEEDGLSAPWSGFVWMNPPFGGRNGLAPWMRRFLSHGDGLALTPDRTSSPWWQDAALLADGMLCTRGKVQFIRPDGTLGKSPSNGTTIWAAGQRAVDALRRADAYGLGSAWVRNPPKQETLL